MPILVNKVGAHRNEDALDRVVYYMMTSGFFKRGNCRGVLGYSIPDIIRDFNFVKQMYDKMNGKQVDHTIIGTKGEGLIEDELIEIAETALDYFYKTGFQCCYALHRGSHEDSQYLHVHMAINTVNFQDGKRLYESYGVTSGLKNFLKIQFASYQWCSANDN